MATDREYLDAHRQILAGAARLEATPRIAAHRLARSMRNFLMTADPANIRRGIDMAKGRPELRVAGGEGPDDDESKR